MTTQRKALFHAAWPALLPYAGLSALVLFVLFLGDYGVPHACGLVVISTEALGWATSTSHPLRALWPVIPTLAITFIAFTVAMEFWRKNANSIKLEHADIHYSGSIGRRVSIGLAAVCWGTPFATMGFKLGGFSVLEEAVTTYASDLAWTLAVAGTAGCVSAITAVGLAAVLRPLFVAPWFLLFGACPGAIVGMAMVAGYNHEALGWVYDDWPILVLCYVARFGWIPILTAALSVQRSRSLALGAQCDGATPAVAFLWIVAPVHRASWFACAAMVAALSAADVAASTMVRVPRFSPIAHILIEKFHRFEDGMLISLSLILVGVSVIAAAIVGGLARRRD